MGTGWLFLECYSRDLREAKRRQEDRITESQIWSASAMLASSSVYLDICVLCTKFDSYFFDK